MSQSYHICHCSTLYGIHCPQAITSPISAALSKWEEELEADEDNVYILNGEKNGFRLTGVDQEVKSVKCNNYVFDE